MTDGQYYIDQERVYHDGLTSIAQSGRRKVSSGCKVEEQTVPDMTVQVGNGTIYFADQLVGINATVNLTVPAAHPTFNRYDIVVINDSGTVSLLSGTAKSESDGYGPVPPVFDAETYLVVARITVENNTSTIEEANIKDLRAIGSVSGSGGGIGSYNVTVTDSTSTTVIHNLNDSIPDVEVWTYNTSSIEIVIPASVQYVDDNTLFVEFDTTSDVRISVQGGVFNNLNVTQARDEVTITNATTDTYTHSFAVKPLVQFVNNVGVVDNSIISVDHISDNTITTTFSSQTSGTLILCGGAFGSIKTSERYQLQSVLSDTDYAPDSGQIGPIPTTDFAAETTSGIVFGFMPQHNQDCTEDMELEIQYLMSDTTSGTVVMQLDVSQFADGDTATSTVETSFTETLTVPTTVNVFDIHKFSTIKIPSDYLDTSKITTMELWRQNTDTNGSNFRMINLDLIYQTN